LLGAAASPPGSWRPGNGHVWASQTGVHTEVHTYFVAGELNAPAVWVHNKCGPGHGEDLYHMVDEEAGFWAKGWVEDGTLKMSLNVRREIRLPSGETLVQRGSLRGKQEFQAILKHFEGRFTKIRGVWAEELPDNLRIFNSLVESEGRTAAAWATKTGQWAREAGYSAVYPRVLRGEVGRYSHVEVDFMLPRGRR